MIDLGGFIKILFTFVKRNFDYVIGLMNLSLSNIDIADEWVLLIGNLPIMR